MLCDKQSTKLNLEKIRFITNCNEMYMIKRCNGANKHLELYCVYNFNQLLVRSIPFLNTNFMIFF